MKRKKQPDSQNYYRELLRLPCFREALGVNRGIFFISFHVARIKSNKIFCFLFRIQTSVKLYVLFLSKDSFRKSALQRFCNQVPFALYPYSSYRTADLNFLFSRTYVYVDDNHRETLISSSFEAVPASLFLDDERKMVFNRVI